MELTVDDLNFILQSLEYTEKAFREYTEYPSYEFKQQRIADVRAVKEKIRAMKRGEGQ